MRKVSSGKMTMGQISGEVIYYIGEGAEKIVVEISKDKFGLFHADIYIGGKNEQTFVRDLSSLSKIS